MKLTKSDREAFVRAVMDDVPTIDYNEQCRSIVKAWGISTLPEELQPIAKKHPEFFGTRYIYAPSGLDNLYAIAHPDFGNSMMRHKSPEEYAKVEALGEASRKQNETRNALREKLTATIGACSTLKQAKERLPEFEKYLPAERGVTGTINLPVANLVAELMNAGWPKGVAA
jgi:hypothetical protein